MQKGQSSSSTGFLEETRLGQWQCMPICACPPWPTGLSPHGWISAYCDIRKCCQSYQVSTCFMNVNGKLHDRTVLQAELHLCPFKRKPPASQAANIHLQAPNCTFPFLTRKWSGGGGQSRENIGRSWKVLWWVSAGNRKAEWLHGRERVGRGDQEGDIKVLL